MTDEGQKAIEAAGHAINSRTSNEVNKEQAERMAKAAIRAYLAALSGWRLVPTQATESMQECWRAHHLGGKLQGVTPAPKGWEQMLISAPPPLGLESDSE